MVTFLNKEGLTTKLILIIIWLTAGSALLVPATYASFHPVTTGEIADNSILSVDIGNGQVRTEDIADRTIRRGDVAAGSLSPILQIVGSNVVNIDPGNNGRATAMCPSGYRVTGGGFSSGTVASGNIEVFHSVPWDESSWVVTAYNNQPTGAFLFAYAVCMGPIPP